MHSGISQKEVYGAELTKLGKKADENGVLSTEDQIAFKTLTDGAKESLSEADSGVLLKESVTDIWADHLKGQYTSQLAQYEEGTPEYDNVKAAYDETIAEIDKLTTPGGKDYNLFEKAYYGLELDADDAEAMKANPVLQGAMYGLGKLTGWTESHYPDPMMTPDVEAGDPQALLNQGIINMYEQSAPRTDAPVADTGGTGAGGTTTTTEVGFGGTGVPDAQLMDDVVDNLPAYDPGTGVVEDIANTDTEAIEREMTANNQAISDLRDTQMDPPEEYVPDKKFDMGYLSDAGRAIMGMYGASKEVPKYEMSAIMEDYVNRTRGLADMGLTPEERDYRNRQSERGYAYDVSNIRRLSGGSAGVALANLGRAAGTLQSQYSQTAAIDEATRRQNLDRYGRAAGAVEQVNRQQYEDNLSQVMLTKQAGAGLAQSAIQNALNRKQYNETYGPGSMYDRYYNSVVGDMEQTRELRHQSYQNYIDTNVSNLEQRNEQLQMTLDERNGTVTQSPAEVADASSGYGTTTDRAGNVINYGAGQGIIEGASGYTGAATQPIDLGGQDLETEITSLQDKSKTGGMTDEDWLRLDELQRERNQLIESGGYFEQGVGSSVTSPTH
jgi:predicted negative regulator of RcsB-dependent stress response